MEAAIIGLGLAACVVLVRPWAWWSRQASGAAAAEAVAPEPAQEAHTTDDRLEEMMEKLERMSADARAAKLERARAKRKEFSEERASLREDYVLYTDEASWGGENDRAEDIEQTADAIKDADARYFEAVETCEVMERALEALADSENGSEDEDDRSKAARLAHQATANRASTGTQKPSGSAVDRRRAHSAGRR